MSNYDINNYTQAYEMNKAELHKNIRWGARQIRDIEVGDTYDYNVNFDYHALRDSFDQFIAELRKRGVTKTDQRVIDTYMNARFSIDDALDAVMNQAS